MRVRINTYRIQYTHNEHGNQELFLLPVRVKWIDIASSLADAEARDYSEGKTTLCSVQYKMTLARPRSVTLGECVVLLSLVERPSKTSASASFVVHDRTTTRRKRNGTRRWDNKLVTIVAGRWRRLRFVRPPPDQFVTPHTAVFLYRRRSFFTGHCSRLPLSVVSTRFIRVPTVRYSTYTLLFFAAFTELRFVFASFYVSPLSGAENSLAETTVFLPITDHWHQIEFLIIYYGITIHKSINVTKQRRNNLVWWCII